MESKDDIGFENKMMDEQSGFSPPLLTVAAVLTFIIMVIGIFGNLLTVVALLKCPKVRNIAAAFIISLCVADLLFCALVLPFSAFRFIEGTWTHGNVLCKLIPFIQYGNIGVSLLCIAMITINRYVMIAHHNSYCKIYKKYWIAVMIGFCWLFSYGMQLPTLFGVWGVFNYDPKLRTCSIMNDERGKSSKTTLFITAFIIPCLIIIACYTKIFWIVHKSELRLKNHAQIKKTIPNNQRQIDIPQNVANDQNSKTLSNNGSSSSFTMNIKPETLQKQTRIKDQRDLRAKRNEWRITKMVLAIFLSFVVCYLPITLAKVADKNVEHPGFHIFSYIMLYLSSCINPIIYVIMNKQYRKAYKTVLLCEPSRLLPFGKAAGGSSAGEKWKDIGLNNNHSRTIVSQMSIGEAQSTSLSITQPTPVLLETINKLSLENTEDQAPQTKSDTSNEVINRDSNIQSRTTKGEAQRYQSTVKIPITTPQTIPSLSRISGTSIIIEEEEEIPKEITILKPRDAEKVRGLKIVNIPTIGNQNKAQHYGLNINAIPDNNLQANDHKISKD